MGGILFAPFTGGASLAATYYGAAAAIGGATASQACLITHTCTAKNRQGMHFEGISIIFGSLTLDSKETLKQKQTGNLIFILCIYVIF